MCHQAAAAQRIFGKIIDKETGFAGSETHVNKESDLVVVIFLRYEFLCRYGFCFQLDLGCGIIPGTFTSNKNRIGWAMVVFSKPGNSNNKNDAEDEGA